VLNSTQHNQAGAPAVALFMGIQWFDERLGAVTAGGVALVLVGGLIAASGTAGAVDSD